MDFLKTKENRQHSSALIPFSLYRCHIPDLYANVPMHWHDEFELNYILKGKGQILLNGEKYLVSKGDILLIPPTILHTAYARENTEFIYDAFVFHPSVLGSGSSDRCTLKCIYPLLNGQMKLHSLISHSLDSYPAFHNCVEQILSCAGANDALSDLLLKSELLRFFWLVEKEPSLILQREAPDSHDSELIRPVLAYMAEHFAEDLTIDQLAAYSHLSKSYFMCCFKRIVGMGAIEHLTQLRIMASCEALVNSGQRIADIACSCGYDNLSNFNRQFKKLVGTTPGCYRKNKHAAAQRSSHATSDVLAGAAATSATSVTSPTSDAGRDGSAPEADHRLSSATDSV